MISDFQELWLILFQTGLILLVLMIFYRRHIISVFDPLFIFLVTQAFSIELAFLTIKSPGYLINFLFCQLFFTVGFLVFAGKPIKGKQIAGMGFLQPDASTISTIKVFSIVVTILIILANIYLISQVGVALLADDPSAAKGENFVHGGGLGFIRRMNWGLLYLCSLLLVYLIIYKKSFFYVLLTFVLIFILILSGSKGVLLYFITLIPLLSKFESIKKLTLFKWINYSKYILLLGGLILALWIIWVATEGTSDEAVFKLGTRFLYFGDAMLYYYDKFSVRHFSNHSISNFILMELNPVLGFFRLVPYQRPIGFDMVEYQTNIYWETALFGPNVPYYVKGHMFFGNVGAVVYAFFVGGVVGGVRSLFYKLVDKPKGLLISLIIIHLNLTIYSYPQDSQLFLTVLFDTFFQFIPVYAFIYLFLKGSTSSLTDMSTAVVN